MTTSEVVDADSLAASTGVSRRTVMRAAQRAGAVVMIGNKGFVRRTAVPAVLGKRYAPSVASIGGQKVDKPQTLQGVADAIGCSRSTILRVLKRTGLGSQFFGRRCIPSEQIPLVKASVLKCGLSTVHLDPKKMSDHARRMAAASARVRRKAAKVRRSKVAEDAS